MTEHGGLTKILFCNIESFSILLCRGINQKILKIYSHVSLNILQPVLQEKLHSRGSITKSNTLPGVLPVQTVFEN